MDVSCGPSVPAGAAYRTISIIYDFRVIVPLSGKEATGGGVGFSRVNHGYYQ